ncbi:MAG: hypothetical protein IJE68_04295 [Clostridia bacterium]|nr:hypothetical protein [Clostridia bacterium]
MAYHMAKRDDNLEKIAQIMSERTGYKVTAKDVQREVDTITTSIFSAVIHDRRRDPMSPATSIICKVRKWEKKQNEYEVNVERLQ